MVVMRLNNPDDQAYIARVVSDYFSSLIEMLPIMRPGEGFILGDCVLMPLRTLIDLPARPPRSADVDFFGIWTGKSPESEIDEIVEHWWRQDRQVLNRLPDADPEADADSDAEPAAVDAPIPFPKPVLARSLRPGNWSR
jgi:hypothetical protein